jgi:putative flippase GtrA
MLKIGVDPGRRQISQVSSIRQLYARFRHLIHEGFKFLVIGAIGAAVTFGVANALHPIGKYKAITIATILATVITFLGNRYWTFRHREGKGTTRESILFFALNGVGLLIYYGCIGLAELAGLSSRFWYNVALVVGTGLGTLFRFWSYRRWVWKAPGGAATAASADVDESDEERARELAAVFGAAPVGHGYAGSAWTNGYRPASSTANGSSPVDSSAESTRDSASGAAASPHSHARPGRPSFRQPPGGRAPEPNGHAPASHRRTS